MNSIKRFIEWHNKQWADANFAILPIAIVYMTLLILWFIASVIFPIVLLAPALASILFLVIKYKRDND